MMEDSSIASDELLINSSNEACQSMPSTRSVATSLQNADLMPSTKLSSSSLFQLQRSQSLPFVPVNEMINRPPDENSNALNARSTITPDSLQASSLASAPLNFGLVSQIFGPDSGDMRIAKHRLVTFRKFWSRKNIFSNIQLLVMCGFYCIGQGDAVECFFCHVVIGNWIRNDNPRNRHLEISPECEFANGKKCGDTPFPMQIQRDGERRLRTSNLNRNLLNTNGQASRQATQPQQTATRSGINPVVRSNTGANERTNLLIEFPCANPANPSMREEQSRLQTFRNSEFRRNTSLRASDETLAKAGLYYVYESDKTQCWFCDGGLKDYLINDDPWVEHAKYYPDCEYLLQQRGPAWIYGISLQNPNIVRQIFPTRDSCILPPRFPSTSPSSSYRNMTLPTRQMILEAAMQTDQTMTAMNMGFDEQLIKDAHLKKLVDTGICYESSEMLIEALLNSSTELNCLEPPGRNNIDLSGRTIHIRGGNFSGRNIINGVLYNNPISLEESGLAESGTTIDNVPVEELNDQWLINSTAHPHRMHVFNNIDENVTIVPGGSSLLTGGCTSIMTGLPENRDERLNILENERRCKICLYNIADILLMPCRHICACSNCSRRLNNCPVCRGRITGYARTYHA